jgi:putative membrane protein
MLKKCLVIAAAGSFCAFMGFGMLAQTARSQAANPAMSKAPETPAADRTFAMKAAQGGLAEVKMGQLASERGSSEVVKEFGKRMVNDHKKANDKLMDVAKKENIDLPSDLDSKDQANYDKLSKLSGAAFDKEYAQLMVSDHTADVSEFQKEARNGKDEAIKDFASSTVPTLEDHLRQAKEMRQSVDHGSSGTQQ